MSPYIGYDSEAFFPRTLNSDLTITGGGITQTGGDVSLDSGTLFIDEDLNRVGIGITDPSAKLHIGDDNLFSGGDGQIVFAVTPSTSLNESSGIAFGTYSIDDYWKQGIFWKRTGSYGRGELHFANRSSTDQTTVSISDSKMMIDETGNVGIGVNNPGDWDSGANKLVVGSSTDNTGITINTSHSTNCTGTIAFATADASSDGNEKNGAIVYAHHPSIYQFGKMHFSAGRRTSPYPFTISGTGRVGINTNDPQNTFVAASANNQCFEVNPSSTIRINNVDRGNQNTWLPFSIQANDFTLVNSSNTSVLTVASDGNVGIGTTNPQGKLEVTGGWTYLESVWLKGTNTLYLNDGNWSLGYSGTGLLIQTTSSDDVIINSNNFIFSGYGQGEKVRITNTGNVGIGTTNPSEKLQVEGNLRIGIASASVNFTDSGSTGTKHLTIGADNADALLVTHSSGFGVGYFGYQASDDRLIIACDNGSENNKIDFSLNAGTATNGTTDNIDGIAPMMRIMASGNVGIGTTDPQYKLEVVGSFAATTKSFIIPHPTKEGYKLRYGSLEGPENGIYVRGRSKDSVIELPEYWTKLVDPDSITVTLTPIGSNMSLGVERIENNRVYVFTEDSRPLEYFYMINAERVDVEPLEVEIPPTN